jgi:transposase
MAPPGPTETKTIGVDDWAFCKGHTYGTIIVDLEQSRVLDLLPDRQSETLAQWLLEHPGVTVVSRDRAGAYGEGVRLGAPEAEQVADRWHLLKNVAEALLQVLTQHQKAIADHLSEQCVQPEEDTSALTSEHTLSSVTKPAETAAQIRRQTRIAAVHQRHQQGWSMKAIAQELRLDRKTVRKHLQTKLPLLRQPRSRRRSLLDPYKSYLLTRWRDGCHNAAQLWRDLQAQGFMGKERIVRAYVGQLRLARNGNKSSRGTQSPNLRQLVWRALKRVEEQSDEEDTLLVKVREAHPEVATALALAKEFASLMRQRQSQQLDDWLRRAQTSKVAPFRKLALSLQQDYAAVKAGLTLSVSNGPVEGHINRLKLLKRQMYGRAKLDLLRNRLMAA